jgi:adenylylsulfate kinase
MLIVEARNHPGFGIWLTGLPASGKSAITRALVRRLEERGIAFTVLESDVLRKFFSKTPSYSGSERDCFYASLAFIGKVLSDRGINVIFDATANLRSYRDRAREEIARFVEVYVETPLEICMQRDPKGIYRQALAGGARNVPGLQANYEPPRNPEVVIHGVSASPDQAAEKIMAALQDLAIL